MTLELIRNVTPYQSKLKGGIEMAKKSFPLSKVYGLHEIDQALSDLEKGAALRPILDLARVR